MEFWFNTNFANVVIELCKENFEPYWMMYGLMSLFGNFYHEYSLSSHQHFTPHPAIIAWWVQHLPMIGTSHLCIACHSAIQSCLHIHQPAAHSLTINQGKRFGVIFIQSGTRITFCKDLFKPGCYDTTPHSRISQIWMSSLPLYLPIHACLQKHIYELAWLQGH